MDRATFDREAALNRQAYEGLREQIREDYNGQYVALARGKVVAVARSFDEARDMVERLCPVPEYYLVFPADLEPTFALAYDFK